MILRRLTVVTIFPLSLWLLSAFDTAHSAGADVRRSYRDARYGVSFIARSEFHTAPSPASMTTGDFDRDGVLDIATVSDPLSFPSTIPNTVTILLGRGVGAFTAMPDLILGANLRSRLVVAGEFNGDTSLDLAVANQFNGAVNGNLSILTGSGDGTFETAGEVPVGKRPVALETADFNDDGRPDLAALNSPLGIVVTEPASISILLGQGDGTFLPLPAVTVGSVAPSLAVGEFTNDGRTDLAVATSQGVSLLIGLGNGTFHAPSVVSSAPAGLLAVGDVDDDGHADLAVATGRTGTTSMSILLGHGDGTFQTTSSVLMTGDRPSALAIGDFDGDDLLDLLIADFIGTVSIARGLGGGTFNALLSIGVGNLPNAMAKGDLNRDGHLDVATANWGGDTVSILLSRGGGRFDVAPAYTTGACCPSSLVVEDFDGDGHVDLAESNFPDKSISILRGLGDGEFQSTTPVPAPDFPWEMAAADFNRDGRLDLATTNPGVGGDGTTVSILLRRNDGSYEPAPALSLGPIPVAIVSADLNRDGRADLAVTFGASVSIFLGRGDGTFQTAPTVAVGPDPLAMVGADVNADSVVDLVVANTNQNPFDQPGSISILLGRGDGTFQVAPEITVGLRPISVAVGDLNGDDRLDLAVANQFGSPPMSILLGTGNGTFQAAPDVAITGNRVVIADFNRDRRQDLAVSNVDTNYVALLLGRGDGTFKVKLLAGVGQAPAFMVHSDFDGDGRLDLATADYSSQTVSILINRRRLHSFLDHGDVPVNAVSGFRQERHLDSRFPLWFRMALGRAD